MSNDVVGLPSSWCKVRISDVADVNPKGLGSGFAPADGDEVHFVPMSAVAPEFGGIDVSQRRPFAEVRKGYTQFSEDDVLLAKITPCMENGKIAIVPELPARVGFGSTEFHVLRSGEAVQPAWLALYLSQQAFRKEARQNMTGSAGQLRVSTGWLSSAELPLPPAAEQSRIVAKLDELLSDLDAGVAELKAAQAKLQLCRQSLLKAAVEGSLTRAWREAHPAPEETGADLLARILRERRARWEAQQLAKFEAQGKAPPKGWQTKYAEPLRSDTTQLPGLPTNWAWASVEQLATLLSGHTPKDAGDYATANAAVQWFKVSDMNRAGNEEQLIAAQTAFDAATAELLGLKVAPPGTIVFPKRGGAIATNKKRRLGVSASYDLNMMGLLPLEAVADWLWWWFSGIDLGRLSDGSNVPQINNPDIAPLPVPLPPLMEQAEIIGILSDQSESLAALEAATDALQSQSTAQRQNLLRAAFAGQLVPQDPADEPAAALLARIRAARAAAQPAAKRSRSTQVTA